MKAYGLVCGLEQSKLIKQQWSIARPGFRSCCSHGNITRGMVFKADGYHAENSEILYYFVRRHQLVRMQFLSQIFISIEMKLYILLMAQFHQYVLYRKDLKHLKSFWCNISKQGNYCNLTQVLKEFRYLISWVCTKMIIYE